MSALPQGPYCFDDILSHRSDDGLGFIYGPSGSGPTFAHTGDTALQAETNRALGHLFAAAPDLLAALEWLHSGKGEPVDVRAAIAKARGAA